MCNPATEDTIGALFDLDGVLMDTESVYTEFWDEMNRIFPTGIHDFAHVIKGTTLPQILDRYFPDPNVKAELLVRLRRQEDEMIYRPFDGVRELLESLAAANIPAAIVTSSNDVKMSHVYEQVPWLRAYFHNVITDRDVTHSKPNPEGYLTAAARLGCRPERCVVFEDSLAGVEAGRRSGAAVVGVATTNSREALAGLADVVVDTLAGLTAEHVRQLALSRGDKARRGE